MNYRPDIDGIRAIAVISVVLFHLKFDLFKGGFVGVDIFYVISGYLVSAQILSRLDKGVFHLTEFYSSRVRRLFPALFVTIAVTFIASAFILLPGDFERFSASALSALASVSNILFYAEAGYWDQSGNLKPLLHTWSLGVEEQFYLFWPMFFILMFKLAKVARVTTVLLVTTVVGLAVSEWMVRVDTSAAFYLFPFRIFQFAAGAVAFRLVSEHAHLLRAATRPILRVALFTLCLGVVAGCAVFYSGSVPFPGLWALPPTIATMGLLILGAPLSDRPFAGATLLALPPMVWLGKLSYSLYLVHWPIISLYLYTTGFHGGLSLLEQAMLFIIMMVAAAALYYGVETRFYTRAGQTTAKTLAPDTVLKTIGTTGLVVGSLSLAAVTMDGWHWRFPELKLTEADIAKGTKDRFQDGPISCIGRDYWQSNYCDRQAPTQVLVLGNSLEIDAYTFLVAGFAENPNINLIQFGSFRTCERGLKLVDGKWTAPAPGCQAKIDGAFSDKLVDRLTHVVFASPFSYEARSKPYLDTITSLKARNPAIQVVIFGPYLTLQRECSYFASLNRPEQCVSSGNVVRFGFGDPATSVLKSDFDALEAVTIDRVRLLCKDESPESCAHSTPQGHPVFWDTRHFSYEFARWAGTLFAQRHPDFFSTSAANLVSRKLTDES